MNVSGYAIEPNVSVLHENSEAVMEVKERAKEMIYISISDTGKGISSNILPKLFQKFVTDSEIGTGLGLYISRNLVEAYCGKVWAFNNADGIGSTFIFSLPKTDSTGI